MSIESSTPQDFYPLAILTAMFGPVRRAQAYATTLEPERTLLEDALSRNRFNQRATATALGLSYDQLRHALKRHRLQDSAARGREPAPARLRGAPSRG